MGQTEGVAVATGGCADPLDDERRQYRGTAGESALAVGLGLQPAFRHEGTGEVVAARFADGRPAPLHVLDGLPEGWIAARDDNGRALRTRPDVVCGFLGAGRFYTRAEAAACFARP